MSYYVYMLKSKSIKPVTYVGYTNDLKKRITLHNTGKGAKFTRGRKWVLIYKEKYKSKSVAFTAQELKEIKKFQTCTANVEKRNQIISLLRNIWKFLPAWLSFILTVTVLKRKYYCHFNKEKYSYLES